MSDFKDGCCCGPFYAVLAALPALMTWSGDTCSVVFFSPTLREATISYSVTFHGCITVPSLNNFLDFPICKMSYLYHKAFKINEVTYVKNLISDKCYFIILHGKQS